MNSLVVLEGGYCGREEMSAAGKRRDVYVHALYMYHEK